MQDKYRKCIELQELESEAYDLLKAQDFKGALKIGKKLSVCGLECGFLIQGMAYAGIGEKEKAREILADGREIFPESWKISQSLGICHANLGEYDEAIKYYDDGLYFVNSAELQLCFNRASDLKTLGRLDEALDDIEYAVSLLDDGIVPESFNDIMPQHGVNYGEVPIIAGSYSLLISICNQLGKYDKAKEAFEKFFDKYDVNEFIQTTDVCNQYSPGLSAIYSGFAMTLWKSEETDKALELIKKAIALNKWNKNAQFLIREIRNNNDYSNAKYMRIFIEGLSNDVEGFFIYYDVVADDEIEALNFIKEFEPEEIRNSLKIKEMEILDSVSKQPKGIYNVGEYYSYPLTEEN